MTRKHSGNVHGKGAPVEEPPKEETPSPGERAFNAESPYNVILPSSPVLDVNSTAMVNQLCTELPSGGGVANLFEFGTPVWEAKTGDPVFAIHPNQQEWIGHFNGNVPIPSIAKSTAASGGSDGSMIVIDTASQWGYDFFQASKVGAEWKCEFDSRWEWKGTGTPGYGASGAGIPLLATLTRVFEMEQGHIDHCVSIATKWTSESFRFPATKSDGRHSGIPFLPEGTKLQLNPAVNVAAIPGIPAAERIVGEAMQKYGVLIKNTSGAIISVGFEVQHRASNGEFIPMGSAENVYNKLGWSADFRSMSHIPWKELRVLQKWDGK